MMTADTSAAPARNVLARLWRAAKQDLEPVVSRRALAELAASLPDSAFATTRTMLLRAAGVRIGAHSLVQGSLWLTGVGDVCQLLTIGEGTLITRRLHVDLGGAVRIGNHVRIGHEVSILTVTHEVGGKELRAGTRCFAEVSIEDGCWLGSRCTILPGVVVGRGAVVAAGAVVTRSVPPNSLVAGVPARVVRELPAEGENEGYWERQMPSSQAPSVAPPRSTERATGT